MSSTTSWKFNENIAILFAVEITHCTANYVTPMCERFKEQVLLLSLSEYMFISYENVRRRDLARAQTPLVT